MTDVIDRDLVERFKVERFGDWKTMEDRNVNGDVITRSAPAERNDVWANRGKPSAEKTPEPVSDPRPGRHKYALNCDHLKAGTDIPAWRKYGKCPLGKPRRQCPKCLKVEIIPEFKTR